jgi:hypothetical protein
MIADSWKLTREVRALFDSRESTACCSDARQDENRDVDALARPVTPAVRPSTLQSRIWLQAPLPGPMVTKAEK